jgi:hypothetical protein
MDPQVPQTPENQSVTPAAPAPVASGPEYASNPFRPLLDVLGKSLTLNGISALQLGILGVLVGVAGYLVVLFGVFLLSSLLHLAAIGVLLTVLAVLALLYYVMMITAGFIKLIEDSSLGATNGWKQYFAAGRPFAFRLLGLAILATIGISIGFVLLVIPGLYLMGRWGLAPFVMVQENLGVMASFKRSRQLTKGHVWEVLGSIMAGGLLGSNGFLAGLVLPSALVGRYAQLRDLEAGKVSKPKLHWLNWLMVLIFPIFFGGVIALSALSSAHKVQQEQQPTFEQLYQQQLQDSQTQSQ